MIKSNRSRLIRVGGLLADTLEKKYKETVKDKKKSVYFTDWTNELAKQIKNDKKKKSGRKIETFEF